MSGAQGYQANKAAIDDIIKQSGAVRGNEQAPPAGGNTPPPPPPAGGGNTPPPAPPAGGGNTPPPAGGKEATTPGGQNYNMPGNVDPTLPGQYKPGVDPTLPKGYVPPGQQKQNAEGGGGDTPPPAGGDTPPEFNHEAYLKHFNETRKTEFKSWDDIYNVINKGTQFDALSKREAELRAQAATFKNPLQEKENEGLAKLYNFQKETGLSVQQYSLLENVDLDKMDAIDKIILHQVIEHPERQGEAELLREMTLEKYGLDDEDLDPKEKKKKTWAMEDAAKDADTFLRKNQAAIKVPDFGSSAQVTEEAKAKMAADEKSWEEQYIPNLISGFEKFPVYESHEALNKAVADGGEPMLQIDIPQDVRDAYQQKFVEYVKQTNMPLTQENVHAIQREMYYDYVSNNYLHIANAYANKKLEANNQLWKERTGVDISKVIKGQEVPRSKATTKVEEFNKKEHERVMANLPNFGASR